MRRLIQKQVIHGTTPRSGVAAARQRAGQLPVRTSYNLAKLKSTLAANRYTGKGRAVRHAEANRPAFRQNRVAGIDVPQEPNSARPALAERAGEPLERRAATKRPLPPAQTSKKMSTSQRKPPFVPPARGPSTRKASGSAKIATGRESARHAPPSHGPGRTPSRRAATQNRRTVATHSDKNSELAKSESNRPSFFSSLGSGMVHLAQATGKAVITAVQVPAKAVARSKGGGRVTLPKISDEMSKKGTDKSPHPKAIALVGAKQGNDASQSENNLAASASDTGKTARARDAAKDKPSDGASLMHDHERGSRRAPGRPPMDEKPKADGRTKSREGIVPQHVRWNRQRRARSRITNRRHDMQLFRRERLGRFVDHMFGRDEERSFKKKALKPKEAEPNNFDKLAPNMKGRDNDFLDLLNPFRRQLESRKEPTLQFVKSRANEPSAMPKSVTEAAKHLKDRAREVAPGVQTKGGVTLDRPTSSGFLSRFVSGVQNNVRDSLTGLSGSFEELPIVQKLSPSTEATSPRSDLHAPLEELPDRGDKDDSQKRLLPPIPCKRLCCHR